MTIALQSYFSQLSKGDETLQFNIIRDDALTNGQPIQQSDTSETLQENLARSCGPPTQPSRLSSNDGLAGLEKREMQESKKSKIEEIKLAGVSTKISRKNRVDKSKNKSGSKRNEDFTMMSPSTISIKNTAWRNFFDAASQFPLKRPKRSQDKASDSRQQKGTKLKKNKGHSRRSQVATSALDLRSLRTFLDEATLDIPKANKPTGKERCPKKSDRWSAQASSSSNRKANKSGGSTFLMLR